MTIFESFLLGANIIALIVVAINILALRDYVKYLRDEINSMKRGEKVLDNWIIDVWHECRGTATEEMKRVPIPKRPLKYSGD